MNNVRWIAIVSALLLAAMVGVVAYNACATAISSSCGTSPETRAPVDSISSTSDSRGG